MTLRALARTAARRCDAGAALIFRVDGGVAHLAAHHGRPDIPDNVVARAVKQRRVIHARPRRGVMVMAAPALRDGRVAAVVALYRPGARRFSPASVAQLRALADHAALAIDHARAETDLAMERDRQAAISEVLSLVSHVDTDPQPVFDAIVRSALHLCRGRVANVYLSDGDMVHRVAHNYLTGGSTHASEALARAIQAYPRPLDRNSMPGRVILDRVITHFPDVENDPIVKGQSVEWARAIGYRSGLMVPLIVDGRGIGAIGVARATVGAFADTEIELLKTFAR